MRIFNTSVNHALQFAYAECGSLSLPEFRRLHIEEGLNRFAEEITLFGKVAIQVVGDNGALPLLVHHLGLRETERLLDRGVFEFVLNPTRLLIPVQTHEVTPPLILGTWSAQNFNDPEASLETGLMRSSIGERLTEVERQRLVRKARDHYKLPNQRASNEAVAMTLQAYEQGVFTDFGLEPKDWGETTFKERELLSRLGEDLFLLGIVAEFRYGTLNKARLETLLHKTSRLVEQAYEIQAGFGEIATFEHVPDVYRIVRDERMSFQDAVKLSQSKQGKSIQEWIERTTNDPKSANEIWNSYREANEGKGFFSKPLGKVVKALGSCGLTEIVLRPVGTDPAIRHSAAGGIAILLELYGNALFEGWKPKLFFDELRETIRKDGARD